jgi:ATP-dependent Clp protease ATP-binding subunit ClpA
VAACGAACYAHYVFVLCFFCQHNVVYHAAALFAACAGQFYIGTEHILLGLLSEGEGVAARVLQTLGADLTDIRKEVRLKGLRIHIGAMSRLAEAVPGLADC